MRRLNDFNPEGIRATLKRWYADASQQNRWVVFDGVSVLLVDSLDNLGDHYRSISLVKELGSVVGENAHLTLDEYLYIQSNGHSINQTN